MFIDVSSRGVCGSMMKRQRKNHSKLFTLIKKHIIKCEVLVVAKCLEEKGSGGYWEILSIGVPRDEKPFLEEALEAGHPRTMAFHLSDGVKEVLNRNFAGEQYVLMKKRLAYISKWSNRAEELAPRERALHESLPEHLTLRGKRLLLMGEMLEDAGYPDHKLVSGICGGFNISGWLQQSHVFPRETKRPEHDINTVLLMAKGLNKMTLVQVSSQAGTELAEKIWQSTKAELEKGWVA